MVEGFLVWVGKVAMVNRLKCSDETDEEVTYEKLYSYCDWG